MTFSQLWVTLSTDRPQASASCFTRWWNSAAARRALVGMQPQLRQTPPSLSRSTQATDRPSWAARMAPTYPAGPPPMTTRSNEWDSGMGEGVLKVLQGH